MWMNICRLWERETDSETASYGCIADKKEWEDEDKVKKKNAACVCSKQIHNKRELKGKSGLRVDYWLFFFVKARFRRYAKQSRV